MQSDVHASVSDVVGVAHEPIDPTDLHIVTGAFGYSGKRIAAQLLQRRVRVRTLTNSLHRPNPFGNDIEVHPLDFNHPEALANSLRGASVLYNTYWVRFNHPGFTHAEAVANTLTLFDAAKRANVGRIVHVSITNPDENSPLEYFRDKARLERALVDSGLPHSILRPAVLFGGEDILVNNIAWALRHLPVFAIFGSGDYRLQPIHVDDFAALAVKEGQRQEDIVIDAVGPETFSYRELVERLAAAIRKHRPIISVSPSLGYVIVTAIGRLIGDVVLTRDEIKGLMADLLVTNSPPVGSTKLTEWAKANADSLGKHYASELARRKNRDRSRVVRD